MRTLKQWKRSNRTPEDRSRMIKGDWVPYIVAMQYERRMKEAEEKAERYRLALEKINTQKKG